jgi:hypothetical protein
MTLWSAGMTGDWSELENLRRRCHFLNHVLRGKWKMKFLVTNSQATELYVTSPGSVLLGGGYAATE